MEVNSPKGFKNGELSSEEIKKLFADINKGEIDYIEKTIRKRYSQNNWRRFY